MTFELIDMDGATLQTFDNAATLRRFLVTQTRLDPTFMDDLAVLEYADDAQRFTEMKTAALELNMETAELFLAAKNQRVQRAAQPLPLD